MHPRGGGNHVSMHEESRLVAINDSIDSPLELVYCEVSKGGVGADGAGNES